MRKIVSWLVCALLFLGTFGAIGCKKEEKPFVPQTITTLDGAFNYKTPYKEVDVGGYTGMAYYWECAYPKEWLRLKPEGLQKLKDEKGEATHVRIHAYAELTTNELIYRVNNENAFWVGSQWAYLDVELETLEKFIFRSCSMEYTNLWFRFEYVKTETAEDPTGDVITKGLSSDTTNWADPTYISAWSAERAQTDGEPIAEPIIESARWNYIYASSANEVTLTFSSDVLRRAVEAGYTHVRYKLYLADQYYAKIDGITYRDSDNVHYVNKKISDLLQEDGSYKLSINVEGQEMNITGREGKLYVLEFAFEDPVAKVMEKGFAQENTNWASEPYLAAWEGGGKISYDSNQQSMRMAHAEDGWIQFSGKVLERAAELGYTHITLSTYGAFDFWTTILNPNGTEVLAQAGGKRFNKETPWTATVALADLFNAATGAYMLKLTTAGWWRGCAWYFESVTFSMVETTDTIS